MSQLPRWLEYALVLLGAWVVAGLFVGTPIPLTSNQVWSEKKQDKPVPQGEQVFRQVDLFGKAQEVVGAPVKQVEVVASKLNIKLIGTVVAGRKSAAMVTVQGSKKQQVFFLDETIQPGVQLKKVEVTEIVVDNRGKMERIAIEKGKAIVAAPSNARVRQQAMQKGSRLPLTNRRIDRRNLQKQMRNFSTLLSQARVTPHFTNKKADGFTISDIVKGSLYEEIGLQNGDVIQKVNGESVTGEEQAMRMYRELQHATFIDVEIVRGGSVQQISYTIQ